MSPSSAIGTALARGQRRCAFVRTFAPAFILRSYIVPFERVRLPTAICQGNVSLAWPERDRGVLTS